MKTFPSILCLLTGLSVMTDTHAASISDPAPPLIIERWINTAGG